MKITTKIDLIFFSVVLLIEWVFFHFDHTKGGKSPSESPNVILCKKKIEEK